MFFDGVFILINLHLLKKLELLKLSRKKLWGSKIFFLFFLLFLLQGRYLIIKKYSFYFTWPSQSVL